jgi:hypothetical protein
MMADDDDYHKPIGWKDVVLGIAGFLANGICFSFFFESLPFFANGQCQLCDLDVNPTPNASQC